LGVGWGKINSIILNTKKKGLWDWCAGGFIGLETAIVRASKGRP